MLDLSTSSRVALFMYPTVEYTDALTRHRLMSAEERRTHSQRFNRMMDCRFRRRGWRVVWVTFGCADDLATPDAAALSPFFSFDPSDAFIAVPTTHAAFARDQLYPSEHSILAALQATRPALTDLAVCGFHLGDCVERIAAEAFRAGLPVRVHEDLTDLFFPLARNGHVGIRGFRRHLRWLLDDTVSGSIAREHRTTRPWLLQVP